MRTTVSTKGQIVLPAELRAEDGIEPGQQFEVERVQPGEYLLKRVVAPAKPGLIDLLLSCPVKGWFKPLPSESTDTLFSEQLFEELPVANAKRKRRRA